MPHEALCDSLARSLSLPRPALAYSVLRIIGESSRALHAGKRLLQALLVTSRLRALTKLIVLR